MVQFLHKLSREGIGVARCTVQRLMHADGLIGSVRDKIKRTTSADPVGDRAADLVARDFNPYPHLDRLRHCRKRSAGDG